MAINAVRNLMIERKRVVAKEAETHYNFALIRIGIGIAIAIISYIIFPDIHILPIGIIGGGILSAFLFKK